MSTTTQWTILLVAAFEAIFTPFGLLIIRGPHLLLLPAPSRPLLILPSPPSRPLLILPSPPALSRPILLASSPISTLTPTVTSAELPSPVSAQISSFDPADDSSPPLSPVSTSSLAVATTESLSPAPAHVLSFDPTLSQEARSSSTLAQTPPDLSSLNFAPIQPDSPSRNSADDLSPSPSPASIPSLIVVSVESPSPASAHDLSLDPALGLEVGPYPLPSALTRSDPFSLDAANGLSPPSSISTRPPMVSSSEMPSPPSIHVSLPPPALSWLDASALSQPIPYLEPASAEDRSPFPLPASVQEVSSPSALTQPILSDLAPDPVSTRPLIVSSSMTTTTTTTSASASTSGGSDTSPPTSTDSSPVEVKSSLEEMLERAYGPMSASWADDDDDGEDIVASEQDAANRPCNDEGNAADRSGVKEEGGAVGVGVTISFVMTEEEEEALAQGEWEERMDAWRAYAWNEGDSTFAAGFDPRRIVDPSDESPSRSTLPAVVATGGVHHYNRYGLPVHYATATPPDVSAWAHQAMARKSEEVRMGVRRPLGQDLRVFLLEHLACLTVDPPLA